MENYRAEVIKDDEARNRFLEHIQPLVSTCIGRQLSTGTTVVSRKIDDIENFVNVKLLESWLPSYLGEGNATKAKAKDIGMGIRFLQKSIYGYVRKFATQTYDPRLVPLGFGINRERTLEHPADREQVEASYEQMLAEHLALRKRVDMEVVEKLMWYLAWEKYRSTDGVPA